LYTRHKSKISIDANLFVTVQTICRTIVQQSKQKIAQKVISEHYKY